MASKIVRKSFFVRKADAPADEGKLVFVASDATVDCIGDRIAPKGIDLTQYKTNPVLLWSHDHYTPAIGTADVYLSEDGTQLLAELKFSQATDLAKEVSAAVSEGTIRAVSVGLEVDIDATTPNDFGGFDYPKSRLIELSLCNLPANPNALAQSKAASADSQDDAQAAADATATLTRIKGKGVWIRFPLVAELRNIANAMDAAASASAEKSAPAPVEAPPQIAPSIETKSVEPEAAPEPAPANELEHALTQWLAS